MIEVTVEDSVQDMLCDGDLAWLQGALSALMEVAEVAPEVVVGLVLTDDAEVHALNREYRGVDSTTDVLSFVLAEDGEAVDGCLGDIVVSVPQAMRQAATAEHGERLFAETPFEDRAWGLRHELFFLVVHGLLHLQGYDHATPDEDRLMRDLEKRLYLRSLAAQT